MSAESKNSNFFNNIVELPEINRVGEIVAPPDGLINNITSIGTDDTVILDPTKINIFDISNNFCKAILDLSKHTQKLIKIFIPSGLLIHLKVGSIVWCIYGTDEYVMILQIEGVFKIVNNISYIDISNTHVLDYKIPELQVDIKDDIKNSAEDDLKDYLFKSENYIYKINKDVINAYNNDESTAAIWSSKITDLKDFKTLNVCNDKVFIFHCTHDIQFYLLVTDSLKLVYVILRDGPSWFVDNKLYYMHSNNCYSLSPL